MKFSLVVSHGAHRGKVVPVKPAAFLIGRNSQCHLRPSSPDVSDCHCALFTRNGKVYLRDLDSTAGTHVNGRRVDGEVELADADLLQVGPLRFQARIEAEPAAAPPATPGVNGLARDGDVFVTAPAVAPSDDACSEEDLEEEAARALLDAEPAAEPQPPASPAAARETQEIALHARETQTMSVRPVPAPTANSAVAARAILDQYRQRRTGRPAANR